MNQEIYYEVYYKYDDKESFYSKTKDFGIAHAMVDDMIEKGRAIQSKHLKSWIVEVKSRVIHEEVL